MSLEKLPKKELIRIVKTKDGEVFVDPTGKMNGRGVYLKKEKNIIEKARESKILNKKLDAVVSDDIFEQLLNYVEE